MEVMETRRKKRYTEVSVLAVAECALSILGPFFLGSYTSVPDFFLVTINPSLKTTNMLCSRHSQSSEASVCCVRAMVYID